MTKGRSSVGMLVVVCGLPGVGKSTVAAMIADAIDGVQLRTDVIRQNLVENPQYNPAETQATYEAMFENAAAELTAGQDVVLDGTFSDRAHRDAARSLGSEMGAEYRMIRVVADEAVVKDRLAARTDDVSDAGIQTYLEKKAAFDPVSQEHTVVENSGSKPKTYRQVERWCQNQI